jgi:hypothetical protein
MTVYRFPAKLNRALVLFRIHPGSHSGLVYGLTPCAFVRDGGLTSMDAVQLHARRSSSAPQPPPALPSHARQRELTEEGATSNLGPGATERR